MLPTKKPGPSTKGLTFGTLNIRGLNSSRKQYQLLRLLHEEQLDFLALQETKMAEEEQVTRALQPFLTSYEVCVTHAVGTAGGCFLFLKKYVPLSDVSVITDDHGRFILCDFNLTKEQWRVICIYAPCKVSEREAFFRGISHYIESDRITVLLGDFNCICESRDRTPFTRVSDSSANVLSEIIAENNLEDVFYISKSTKKIPFTHFQKSSHARLDRIYFSSDIVNNIGSYHVKPVFLVTTVS